MATKQTKRGVCFLSVRKDWNHWGGWLDAETDIDCTSQRTQCKCPLELSAVKPCLHLLPLIWCSTAGKSTTSCVSSNKTLKGTGVFQKATHNDALVTCPRTESWPIKGWTTASFRLSMEVGKEERLHLKGCVSQLSESVAGHLKEGCVNRMYHYRGCDECIVKYLWGE